MQLRWVLLGSILIVLCLMPIATWAQESDPETWPIVYQDDFEDPSSGWEVGETEYAARAYVDGVYEIQLKDEGAIACSMLPGDEDLVTSNECQLKALTGGDDLVGLTRSFLVSGAASVLASLWSVHSEATEKLMISFYRHLEDDGMDKAEALRAARIDVMNTPDTMWNQPYYWAAFNLVGNWK